MTSLRQTEQIGKNRLAGKDYKETVSEGFFFFFKIQCNYTK